MDKNKPENKQVPFSDRKFMTKKSAAKGFFDTMFGKSKLPSKESIAAPLHQAKSKFEQEGIRVSDLKRELGKIQNNINIKMEKTQRGKVAFNIKREGSSQIINAENLEKHIKNLKKIQSLGETEQERLTAKQEIYLLQNSIDNLKEQ